MSNFDFNAVRRIEKDGFDPYDSQVAAAPQVWKNHVLVLVSKRFGLERIGPEYFKLIKKYMRLDSFVGIVGGKPRFAYYFVGHMELADYGLLRETELQLHSNEFEAMPLEGVAGDIFREESKQGAAQAKP